ncbi:MAG: D-alanine--D-alanine ligase [Lachnospiraceae bacterium]|nr:D-alanine--D-alanine ligase [Lachnospiraceae bacterium]
MKIRVAVMFGGKSVEHEVSIISGIQAIANMDTEKYEIIPVYISKENEMYVGKDVGNIEAYKTMSQLIKESTRVILVNEGGRCFLTEYPAKRFGKGKKQEIDVAFPVVHGTNVEDGTLQGYLKTVGVPFVGCDVTASAVGMDKYISKMILKDNGVPVLDCLYFSTEDYKQGEAMLVEIEEKMGYPVIVKPANLGSSVGISVAKNKNELISAVDTAFRYANNVIVEHAITKLREINCSVVGNSIEAEASECEEPLHTKDILSYEDKYLSGGKGGSKGMASVQRKIPAELTPEQRERVRSLAVKAFRCLGCNGVSRIDFMIDEENGELYLNEINTIPGSLAFYLWEPLGVSYKELLDRLIKLALKRKRDEENLVFTFSTNLLDSASLKGAKGVKR